MADEVINGAKVVVDVVETSGDALKRNDSAFEKFDGAGGSRFQTVTPIRVRVRTEKATAAKRRKGGGLLR